MLAALLRWRRGRRVGDGAGLAGEILVHNGRDGVGPDLIALRAGVQEIGHDVPRQRSIGLKEFVADVEVGDAWIGSITRDDAVDLLDPGAGRIGR